MILKIIRILIVMLLISSVFLPVGGKVINQNEDLVNHIKKYPATTQKTPAETFAKQ